MPFKFTTEAKVGVFILVMVLISSWGIIKTGKWSFKKEAGYDVYATFPTAQGINPETRVYMAGIPIGQVDSISLEKGKARIKMKINPGVEIPVDSSILIGSKGLVGEKYIEITPGVDKNYLSKGAEFVNTKIPRSLETITDQLGGIAEDIKAVTETLREVLGGPQGVGSLGDIVKSIRDASVALKEMIEANKEAFSRIVDNIEEFSVSMNTISENMQAILDKNQENIDESIEQIRSAARNLDESMEYIASVTRKIDEGKGAIGKLINDEETARNLDEAISGVNTMLSASRRLRTYIGYRGEVQTEESDLKSYLSLRIQPREDKYYLVEIVDDPADVTEVKDKVITTVTDGLPETTETIHEEVTEDKLKFSVQIAKRFYDLTLRGGIIQSEGGIGLDYSFLDDAFNIGVEAFDFGKETNTNLRAYLDVNFLKHLYITGGAEDIINSEEDPIYFLGAGIMFEDEDIRSLLGLAVSGASLSN